MPPRSAPVPPRGRIPGRPPARPSAETRSAANGPSCALIGHMDEIGFIATHVDELGYVAIRRVGGYNAEVLVGQRVEFLSGVRGLVARRREQGPLSERKLARIEDLHVDVGARSGDETRELVRPGDVGVFAAEPVELREGRLVSRALDNRLGCYIALEAARRAAGEATGDVVAIAATQEETGAHGIRSAVFSLEKKKLPYEPPRVLTDEAFEQISLACSIKHGQKQKNFT